MPDPPIAWLIHRGVMLYVTYLWAHKPCYWSWERQVTHTLCDWIGRKAGSALRTGARGDLHSCCVSNPAHP
jgi:hypothetical protein